jgi:hypothetical protein
MREVTLEDVRAAAGRFAKARGAERRRAREQRDWAIRACWSEGRVTASELARAAGLSERWAMAIATS